jgi:ABC-type taurine transport system substrate-binding protein
VLAQVVDDQVVDDNAVLAQHARVERLAGLPKLVDIVGQQPAQVLAYARAAQIDDAHVRDVEHAGVTPHGMMLLDLGAIADRHVPAAEIHHARPGGDMARVERRAVSHALRSPAPEKEKGGGFLETRRPSVL